MQRRNIDDGGDSQQEQEELGRVVEAAQRQAIDRIEQVGRQPVQHGSPIRSNASSTQTNQIGPLGQGPTVTVFHQNAVKPTSG